MLRATSPRRHEDSVLENIVGRWVALFYPPVRVVRAVLYHPLPPLLAGAVFRVVPLIVAADPPALRLRSCRDMRETCDTQVESTVQHY